MAGGSSTDDVAPANAAAQDGGAGVEAYIPPMYAPSDRRKLQRWLCGREVTNSITQRPPPAALLYNPLEYLSLSHCSVKHCGRLAYSYDCTKPLLAIASTINAGNVTVWHHGFDIPAPEKILTLHEVYTRPVTCIEWSSFEESHLCTTSEDGTFKLLDLNSRKAVKRMEWQGFIVYCVTPMSRHTFAVGVNNRLVLVDSRLPDVDGGERTVRRHSGAISDIAATEGSDLLFTSSLDGTVKLWDLRKGSADRQALQTLRFSHGTEGVASLQLHRNQTRLLVGREGGQINDLDLLEIVGPNDWDISNNQGVVRTYRGHRNCWSLKRARLSMDERYVVCGSDDSKTWMWDAETEKVVMKLDGLGASELLGDEPASLSVLSASISHTQPWFQVGMSTDLASFLFSVRAGKDGRPLPMQDCALLDTAEVEEAVYEDADMQMVGEDEDDEYAESWENDPLNLREMECSYGRGYVTQIVYVCDTCIEKSKERLGEADPSVVHGMCMQCANYCHGVLGHAIRNIGEKRTFRCDCGNLKFRCAGRSGGHLRCSIARDKEDNNTENKYSHNFDNRWCYCDREEERPMLQCLGCKDWFHGRCIHPDYDFEKDEFMEEDYLCDVCIQSEVPFIASYPSRPICQRAAWQQELEEANQEAPETEDRCHVCREGAIGSTCMALQACGSEAESCGHVYHLACLAPGQNEKEEDGRWLCPKCKGQEEGEPPREDGLGWVMHKGRFLERGWKEKITIPEHRDIITQGAPVHWLSPGVVAASAEPAEEMKQGEAEVAVGATSDWRVSDASQIDAEIRQAIAAGDEARAFRLAMQRIVQQVATDTSNNRRSIVLSQDVLLAAERLRGRPNNT